MIELSVVLISRNQEWNIARLVESVLRETDSLPAREIVLVDSASTDRTTEIAARYPIKVLKLRPGQRLSAAAGRYVGYKQTTGDLVLFLDGDMELCQGWLTQALGVLHARQDVGVICGRVIDWPRTIPTPPVEDVKTPEAGAGDVDVRQAGGASMYRRSVLEQVGTWNPYLYADEEPELCLRIRQAGFRILRLSYPIVFHLDPWIETAPAETFSILLRKRRARLFLGYGQNIRYFFGSPLFWPYLKERGWAVAPALLLGMGVVAMAASTLTGQWGWLALWVAFVALLTLAIAIRKRSLLRAFLTLFLRLLILEGSVRGLLIKPFNPATYPGKYDVIQ